MALVRRQNKEAKAGAFAYVAREFEERRLLAADSVAYDRLRLLHDSG
jgi:hypothetical protein